jgi:hypothetical protein
MFSNGAPASTKAMATLGTIAFGAVMHLLQSATIASWLPTGSLKHGWALSARAGPAGAKLLFFSRAKLWVTSRQIGAFLARMQP